MGRISRCAVVWHFSVVAVALLSLVMLFSQDTSAQQEWLHLNLNDIAAVPGVGGIFVGQGSDLSMSLGVPLQRASSETERAFQTILKACLSHHVAFGKTMTESEIPTRIKEGWTMCGVGNSSGGLSAPAEAALRTARDFAKR